MLILKCLGIETTGKGKRYRLSDASGAERVLTEEQLRYVLRTHQATCENLVCQNGVFSIKTATPSYLSRKQQYEIYITRQKLMGVTEAVYRVLDDGGILLVECKVERGTFTIPPFVTRIGRSAFSRCIELKLINKSDVTDMSNIFYDSFLLESLDLSSFDTSKVVSMQAMFHDCHSLSHLDLGTMDTSHVTDMTRMFSGCSKLVNLDLRSFNTSKVTSMCYMFANCDSLEHLDLSNFDTGKVTTMAGMFLGCRSLSKLDLASFNTENVTTMQAMFQACTSLKSLNVSSFNTSQVTKMSNMFMYCPLLKSLNVSSFNTSRVTEMCRMFSDCTALTCLDLRSFDFSKVTSMAHMFDVCENLVHVEFAPHAHSNDELESILGMFSCCVSLVDLDLSWLEINENTHIGGIFRNCRNTNTFKFSSSLWKALKRYREI